MALEQSIAKLRSILNTGSLAPQQEKEVRAELEILTELLKKEFVENALRNGISLYGGYFDTVDFTS
jgi:hypothetical protein